MSAAPVAQHGRGVIVRDDMGTPMRRLEAVLLLTMVVTTLTAPRAVACECSEDPRDKATILREDFDRVFIGTVVQQSQAPAVTEACGIEGFNIALHVAVDEVFAGGAQDEVLVPTVESDCGGNTVIDDGRTIFTFRNQSVYAGAGCVGPFTRDDAIAAFGEPRAPTPGIARELECFDADAPDDRVVGCTQASPALLTILALPALLLRRRRC